MVTPYKPQEDCASVSDSPTSIKACSDRAPLLIGDKSEGKKNGICLVYYNIYFNITFIINNISRLINLAG